MDRLSPTSRRRVADVFLTLSETFGTPANAREDDHDVVSPLSRRFYVRYAYRSCVWSISIAHARLSTSGCTSTRPIPSVRGASALQLVIGLPSPPYGHARLSTSGSMSAGPIPSVHGPSTSQLSPPPPRGHTRLSTSGWQTGETSRSFLHM